MSESAAAFTVYAIFPDAEVANRIAEEMIGQCLAACANILSPCQSIYRWEGKIDRAEEVPVLFKTSPAQVEALIAAIATAHPYDVPAITAWPISAAHPPYLEWLNNNPVS